MHKLFNLLVDDPSTHRWPGSEANLGFDQTRGCPITNARVCVQSARENTTVSCAMSDPATGAFLVAAGVGSYIRLDVTYENHTFAISMPGKVEVCRRATSVLRRLIAWLAIGPPEAAACQNLIINI